MLRIIWLTALLVALNPALSLAEILGAGKAYKLHEPIVLEVNAGDIPEGAEVNALWRLQEPAQYRRVNASIVHVWAPAGEYAAMAIVYVTKEVVIDSETYLVLVKPPEEYQDTFKVGGNGPPPDPDPDPDPSPVPPDEFDNIGQRVDQACTGLQDRDNMASCYEVAARSLRSDPVATVDSVSNALAVCVRDQSNYQSFRSVFDLVNADVTSRWPLSKGVLADYYDAVAVGFKGGQ